MKKRLFCILAFVFAGTMVFTLSSCTEFKIEERETLHVMAEQGQADAQYSLGNAYYKGEGVTQDLRKAIRWYRKAAMRGHVEAQVELSSKYFLGTGVASDAWEAYIWLLIAKAYGADMSTPIDADVDLGFLLKTYQGELSQSGIRSAHKEANRRLEAIDSLMEESAESP